MHQTKKAAAPLSDTTTTDTPTRTADMIEDEGKEALSKALKENTTLTDLTF